MTTIVIKKNENSTYRELICMGHAEYAQDDEPDILCSSISFLVINTLNSLEELARETLSVTTNEETGFIRCIFESDLQEKSVFLLDSMVFGLEQLQQEYGEQYLQVRIEEV